MQEILLNIESKETRYAFLTNRVLQDLVIERKKNRQLAGNVYMGRVTNILHNIQSAFINTGEGSGFIHISDIVVNTEKFQKMFELDFEMENTKASEKKKNDETDITKILKIDQPVLVQVVKEPIGTKGARLTSNISLPGRYLVFLPNTPHRGVSRKIEDPASRDRLKTLIRSFEMPQDMGLICRTASVNATAEMLIEEATDLLNTWQIIMDNFNKASRPTLLYEESDLIRKAVMTAVDKKIDRLLVDDYATFQKCKRYYARYSEEFPLNIELYRDKLPMFERFNVDREIDKALRRKIWLPSGGYLYFDKTEAMFTIDVNSGRSTTQSKLGNVEESIVQINMEAAEEIARQLRLRNIGGLIICDFIDMRSRKNQRRILANLKEAMKEDTAKCTLLGMSEFGLVEMTRQRSRESLSQTLFTNCPYCTGFGMIKTYESTAIEIERALKKVLAQQQQFALEIISHPEVDLYLDQGDKAYFHELASKVNAHLKFIHNDTLHLNEFQFFSTTNGKRLDI